MGLHVDVHVVYTVEIFVYWLLMYQRERERERERKRVCVCVCVLVCLCVGIQLYKTFYSDISVALTSLSF